MKNMVNLLYRANSITLKRVAQPYRLISAQEIEIINHAFTTNTKVSVMPPPLSPMSGTRVTSLQGLVCIAGIPLLLQKYPDQSMDIVVTGVEKIRLSSANGHHFHYAYESVFENEKITLSDDLQLLGQMLWYEISRQKALKEQEGQLIKILNDPESILSYTTLLLVKQLSKREEIMRANSFDHKIRLLINYLSPQSLGISSYFRPVTFSSI